MPCVLIVEDQAPLRQHARNIVASTLPEPLHIMDASGGAEGLKLAAAVDPDLIIMDISMPEMSGIKVAQQIWKEVSHRRILFWSQFHREAYVRELGRIVPDEAIHGYALKGESDEKFRAAIISVLLHNNPYIDPVVKSVQSRLACKDQSLSDSEYEALMDVVVGLTDKAIAKRRHISVRGVQNRLSMLLVKLVKGEDSHLKESAQIEIYNPRTRIIFEGLKRGLLDPDDVKSMDDELLEWLSTEYDYERSRHN